MDASDSGGGRRAVRREVALVLLAAALLAALPLAPALFVPGNVAFGVDSAVAQLPWASVHAERPAVTHPALADQAVVFYPFYRWVAQSWLDGDAPTWCPLIYAGAPGFGNAQAGALDPQVWILVALQALGGEALFHWGLGFTAWLRLFVALTGAYALARRLGLAPLGSALAGIAFGFSGFQVLWLNHALGHVSPFLPWILFFLEGIRTSRSYASTAGAALALALAVLGGHVETAFYVGAAAGLWALALLFESRPRGALALGALALGTGCGAVSLIPLYEYLDLSAAMYVRELAAGRAHRSVDWAAVGLLVCFLWLVRAFRGSVVASAEMRAPVSQHETRIRWLAAGAVVLALVGLAAFLATRGLAPSASLTLVPDRFGRPGSGGGYRGEGSYVEMASAWVVFPCLLLAAAGFLHADGPLKRRRWIAPLGALMFALAIELPGLVELYRFVPLVGLGATVRCASVSGLMLGLLAGEALERAGPFARRTAVAGLVALVGMLFLGSGDDELRVPRGAEENELFGVVLAPPAHYGGRGSDTAGGSDALEGWVAAEVPAVRANLVVQGVESDGRSIEGRRFEFPLIFGAQPTEAARRRAASLPPDVSAVVPEGARWFRSAVQALHLLPEGHWRFQVALFGAGAQEPMAVRQVGVVTVHLTKERTVVTWLLLGATVVLVLLRPSRGRSIGLVALAALQALAFAHRMNPILPAEQVFPTTRTEELLARELGPYRFFTDANVLPPNTGLIHGLRGIQGYDAMDVADFNFYREAIVPPGANALLSWTPRGVDLDHPAFRLYGVAMLVCEAPLEHPDWELFARPGAEPASGVFEAETWIYRAKDPVPRAFLGTEVVALEELAARAATDPAFDPTRTVAVEGVELTDPARTAEVSAPLVRNHEARVRVHLDGEGILVLTDQVFPGWEVLVNGEQRPLLTVDMIFRGVQLAAGEHEVLFRYRPRSILVGAWISGLSLVTVLVGLGVGLARRRQSAGGASSLS